MPNNQPDQLCITTIRTLAMDAVQQANSGHPGTPMASAPLHALQKKIKAGKATVDVYGLSPAPYRDTHRQEKIC